MTIQNTTIRKAGPSQGNGVTTVFPFTFKVFTTADILVTYLDASGVESVLVLTTNYTVSLNADQNTSPGGSVTLLVAPATGTYITLTSQVTNTQTLALTNSGGFYPESINNALDRTVIEIQQLAEQASRAVTIPKSSTASPLLPTPAANNVLVWNTTATALVNLPATTGTSLVNLAASTGSTLVGTTNGGTGSVTRTVASKLNDIISVKDFGVVGDGVTNDTAAIQAAINDTAAKNKVLYFPSGTYLIGSSGGSYGGQPFGIYLPSNSNLVGQSSNTCIIKRKDNTDINLIDTSRSSSSNISISGFTLNGNAAGNLTTLIAAGFNFWAYSVTNLKLVDMYSLNPVAWGFRIQLCDTVNLNNIMAYHTSNHAAQDCIHFTDTNNVTGSNFNLISLTDDVFAIEAITRNVSNYTLSSVYVSSPISSVSSDKAGLRIFSDPAGVTGAWTISNINISSLNAINCTGNAIQLDGVSISVEKYPPNSVE